ncbi:MAG: universal stress protein [Bryobacteraceae bacterium]
MKILLAIDSSTASQAALDEVAARPWPAGSCVEVLNVAEPAHLWTFSETAEGVLRLSRELVERARVQLQSRGLQTVGVSSSGDPKIVILDHARTIAADFLVVGSQGTSAVTRFLLGNVAAAVVRHAPCSAEVVRGHRPGGAARKILLATDGSASSEAAARSVAARPWPPGTEIRVLSVVEFYVPTIQALFEPPFVESDQLERLRGEAMKHAQDAVAGAVAILTAANLNVSESVSVLLDGPKRVILEDAKEWGADLIVVGSHGRRGIDRFLMGSVSESVALHAECSVEVIR